MAGFGRRHSPKSEEYFDRFTDRARNTLTLAQQEAQRFNHNFIGTEHILLGLLREGEGVAARVLLGLGVELKKVRQAVEIIIGGGEYPPVGEIGLTPRAKKAIELAVDEGRRLGHHYIGTEHLLLGLIREGEGIAAGVLESLGVNLEKVRSEVIKILAQSGPTSHHGDELPIYRSPARMPRVPVPYVYAFLYTRWEGDTPVVTKAEGIAIGGGLDLHAALDELGGAGWQLGGIDSKSNGEALYILQRLDPELR